MMSRRRNIASAHGLVVLMILAALTPILSGMLETPAQEYSEFEPKSLELGERIVSSTGGRAVCPTTQNDGGTTGDAGNTTSTAKTLGTDPSTQNVPGCVDSSDTLDYYSVTLSANKDFSVELTVPSLADFDLYIIDANSSILDSSEYNDPLESVMLITSTSGTFYVVVAQFSGDGAYSLDMWTNNSNPRPDLTSNGVSGPNTATTGSNVNIGYTINNIGTAALTSNTPYDIPIILSTDTIYDSSDTILSTQITGPNLAINASQGFITSVSIPSSLSSGNYYWLVWPDGWGNVTEQNEFNNEAWSSSTTGISTPGSLSADMFEPNENTSTATVVTLPMSQSNLSLHTTTDNDYYEISMISGETYWFNNTHTYANGDIDMDLIYGTINLASSASSSDDEAITHTASGNFTAYLYIYGYVGATNTYGLTIHSSASSSPTSSTSGPPGAGTTNATILNTAYMNGSHAYDDLYIGCGILSCGTIIATGDLILTVNTLTVDSGGVIYALDPSGNSQGTGTSTTLSSSWQGNGAGGAGHYGNGGSGGGATSNGGSSYGVGNETGSLGGSVYDSSGGLISEAGWGGGRIIIYADTIEIQGMVAAPGTDGEEGYRYNNGSGTGGPGAGGGSGGSIVMRANSVTIGNNQSASGIVWAGGGTGGNGSDGDCLPGSVCLFMYNGGDGGGGGSGGNVDIRASSTSNLNIASTAFVSAMGMPGGTGGAPYGTGAAGTAGSSGDNGIVTTGVWSGWGSTPTPPVTRNESISVSINNHTSADADLTQLTTGTGYAVEYSTWIWNGSSYILYAQHWNNFTASGNNESQPTYFTGTWPEGERCLASDLYESSSSGLLWLDGDIDCLYIEYLEAAVTSNSGGFMDAQNLTIGSSYTYNWWLIEGNSVIADNGSGSFSATSDSWTSSLSWSTPSSATQHYLLVRLYDSSGYNFGVHVDYFIPALPTIFITNATSNNASSTNTIDYTTDNLTVGDDYVVEGYIYSVNSSATTYFSDHTFTSATTSVSWIKTYNTPSASGIYCVRLSLYDDLNGDGIGDSLLSWYQHCFNIINDDDLDGVWNEDDICPNTPANAAVNSVGCGPTQRDTDGDGYNDAVDAFPYEPTQWADADGDGYGDNAGGNMSDAFPADASQWMDSDGDGYGDNANGTTPDACPNVAGTSTFDRYGCPDYDNDGWSDDGDDFYSDPTQWSDTDGDGYGDNPNGNYPDAFPNDSTQWADGDGDGYGDNPNGNYPDAFPSDATQWSDVDGDGYGDNPQGSYPDHCPNSPPGANVDSTGCAASERDTDGDGVMDADDYCVNVDATGWDTDGDGCIDDTDNDGVLDPDDDCRMVDASGWDNDGDGCIDDSDGDNVNDPDDACMFENASGWDTDGNGCIDDTDGDTIKDDVDQCRNVDSTGFDSDGDGCIDDSDGDTVPDNVDQCRYASSAGYDTDGDGCIDDSDGDYVLDDTDTCRYENATGFDSNGDGCIDDSDGDTVKDNVDACVSEDATGFDADNNGCIDDSDGDTVKDNVDDCVDEDATDFDNDNDGCIDDTDGDGVKDDEDDFPTDPEETTDSDEDGVGDNADAYPMDASRQEKEEGGISGLMWAIIIVAILLTVVCAAVILLRRNSATSEEAYEENWDAGALEPAENIYAMAGQMPEEVLAVDETPSQEEIQEGPTTWTDEAGNNWCQYPDGSIMRFDVESGQWVPYQ